MQKQQLTMFDGAFEMEVAVLQPQMLHISIQWEV